MHSVEELRRGLHDDDWRVRHEVVDRLVARGADEPGTLPELLMVARKDTFWQVRSAALMRLSEFDPKNVLPVLHEAANDPHQEVRWAARFSLNQLGENWELDAEAE
jgi:HEAT repeat protein